MFVCMYICMCRIKYIIILQMLMRHFSDGYKIDTQADLHAVVVFQLWTLIFFDFFLWPIKLKKFMADHN